MFLKMLNDLKVLLQAHAVDARCINEVKAKLRRKADIANALMLYAIPPGSGLNIDALKKLSLNELAQAYHMKDIVRTELSNLCSSTHNNGANKAGGEEDDKDVDDDDTPEDQQAGEKLCTSDGTNVVVMLNNSQALVEGAVDNERKRIRSSSFGSSSSLSSIRSSSSMSKRSIVMFKKAAAHIKCQLKLDKIPTDALKVMRETVQVRLHFVVLPYMC